MSILDDFKLYRDKYGLNQLYTDGTQGQVTQNGALFTMEYIICLLASNVPQEEKDKEIQRLKAVYQSLEKFPGVTSRYPNDTEFDSMDNGNAILTFSALFDDGAYSKRAYEHGKNTQAQGIDLEQNAEQNQKFYSIAKILNFFQAPRFFWNCNHPTLFCFNGWFGRSPGYIAYLKMTANEFVGPLGQLIVLISQFLGCFAETGNTDARKLPYVSWQYLKNRNLIWKLFYKFWCYILIKQYGPEGMRAVYNLYYQDKSHPIIKHSKPFVD